MRSKFIGHYPPTEEDLNTTWDKGLVVLDSNCLLNLYRYSDALRDDFIKVLRKVSDRLWLPYQVAHEFHKNRKSVLSKLEGIYADIENKIDNQLKAITQILENDKKYSIIQPEALQEMITKNFDNIKQELKAQSAKHPKYNNNNDPILAIIEELFEGKVGEPTSAEKLEEIYNEGKKRYQDKVPPGYKDLQDKKDKPEQSLYGDLIVWRQTIEHIKSNQTPVLFVTDDNKEDWWDKNGRKTIKPRPELIDEFYKETNIRILIYNPNTFLKYASERLKEEVQKESLEEIEKTVKYTSAPFTGSFADSIRALQDSLSQGRSSSFYQSLKKSILDEETYSLRQQLPEGFLKDIKKVANVIKIIEQNPMIFKEEEENIEKRKP